MCVVELVPVCPGITRFQEMDFFQSLSSFPFSLPSVLGTQISPLPPPRERSRYLPPNLPIFLSPNPPAPKNPISHFKSPKHRIYVDKPVLYQVVIASLFLSYRSSFSSFILQKILSFEIQLSKYVTLLVTFYMQIRIYICMKRIDQACEENQVQYVYTMVTYSKQEEKKIELGYCRVLKLRKLYIIFGFV